MSAIPTLRSWRHKDQKFKAILGYIELESSLGYLRLCHSQTNKHPPPQTHTVVLKIQLGGAVQSSPRL